jgi:hypothetical protein
VQCGGTNEVRVVVAVRVVVVEACGINGGRRNHPLPGLDLCMLPEVCARTDEELSQEHATCVPGQRRGDRHAIQ